MVKILTVEQIREADQYTISHEPISSIELMERAANEVFRSVWEYFGKTTPYIIFCGVGNNGGDGLVLARALHTNGAEVKVYVLEFSENYSEDFKVNLDRLPVEAVFLKEEKHQFSIDREAILVDAIFGSGLNRPIEGFTEDVILKLNQSSNFKLAIDIPSGLFAEENFKREQTVFQADLCLSFQFPKLSFMFPESARYVGYWELLNIGIHHDFVENANTPYHYFTFEEAVNILKERDAFSHKGDHGRVFMLLGSKGKMGAAVLSARACLRAGAGLLTVQIPAIGYTTLQTSIPEAMVEVDSCTDHLSELKGNISFNALGMGPGIGQNEETQQLLKLIIQQSDQPILLDADALNILAENKTWISFLPKNSILTPHPGEFKRLVGEWTTDFERLQLQIEFSKKYNVFVLLKGRHSSISCPDGKVFFNSTGNAGMATAGSGDVLSGIVSSFLAQAYNPKEAVLLAAFIHGLAGDIAVQELTEEAMIASDIIDFLPNAFKELKEEKQKLK